MQFLEDQFKNKKDKIDFFIAIVVIVFFLSGILWAVLGDSSSNTMMAESAKTDYSEEKEMYPATVSENEVVLATNATDNQEDTKITPQQEEQVNVWVDSLSEAKINNTPVLLDEDTEQEEDVSPMSEEEEKEEEIVTQEAFTDTDIDSLGNNLDADSLLMEAEAAMEETLSEDDSQTEIADTDSAYSEDSMEDEETSEAITEEEEPSNEETSTTVTEPAEDAFSDTPCVIMIGAFSDGTNASKLIKRLQQENYVVYSSYRKGYRTVGVRTTCEKEKLKATLSKIKKDYSKSAFIIE